MAAAKQSPPQIAVWCFVGATFAFIAPLTLFPNTSLWVVIPCFAVGLIAMAVGGIQLSREIRGRKNGRPRSEP